MDPSKPFLSLITPVKNAGAWLYDCIRSGQDQDFMDWEWIWVDDHSTDNSLDLLQELAKKDSRIRIFTNPGTGIISALQKALDECRGQFLSRMDADDLMPEGRLQRMVSALNASPSKTIITGLVHYFSESRLSAGYRTYQQWLNKVVSRGEFKENLYRECVVASPNWIMRTDELKAIGGFTSLEYPEDYDLVFRWFKNGFSLQGLPEVTLLWREHPGRTSRSSPHYSQEAFFRLKLKRFTELSYSGSGVQIWGTGKKARLAQSILRELGIPVTLMSLQKKEGLDHYTNITQYQEPQLLVAVYPPQPQLETLENYLHKNAFMRGRDYWFL